MKRLATFIAAAIALPASAQTTSTQCRWIGNVWSCDSQTQSTAPIDQGAILRSGAASVAPVKPSPPRDQPTPIPPPIDIKARYGLDRGGVELIAEMIKACPARDGGRVRLEDYPEDSRSLIGAICYAYDRGRIRGYLDANP